MLDLNTTDFDINSAAMIETIEVADFYEVEQRGEIKDAGETDGDEEDEEKMDDDDEVDGDEGDEDVVFVKCLSTLGRPLLQKAQTPAWKAKKKDAVAKMIGHLAKRRMEYSDVQLRKKVENMKSRLKKKVDTKKTGNIPIELKPWEQTLFDAMDGVDNPSIGRLACK